MVTFPVLILGVKRLGPAVNRVSICKKHRAIFSSGWTTRPCHRQRSRSPAAPRARRPARPRRPLPAVSPRPPLTSNGAEHPSVGRPAVFRLLCALRRAKSVLLLNGKSSLDILDTSPLSSMCLTDVLPRPILLLSFLTMA